MKTKNIIAVSGESFVLNHGMVESPEPESFPPHIHEAWELLFFLRGDIRYNVLGKSYKLKRGDLVLSRPTVLHRIEPTGSDKYERVNVIFDENMIPESIMKKIPDGVDVFALGAAGRVFDIFTKINEYAESFSGEELSLLVGNLIIEVMYNLTVSDSLVTGQTPTNPLIAEALSYIDENLTSISGVDEICEHLYITKSHLHHLFITHLGVTPKRYVNSKRLLLAQRLIRQGKRASEAASAVGYLDYATFFRGYKNYFGYAPSEENARVSLDAIVG
ncbi:MAG: helix-turn-helix domain-containing protein [Clostridia bacterium]|nr:helix-turn-helix domain-containing protein [Clostridia bacterium]